MGDVPRWDPLGSHDRRRRLLISFAVAVAIGVVLWHLLESAAVQRWIWTHEDWGRLETRLDLAAAAAVPVGFILTSWLLARRSARRWPASQIPQARSQK